MNVKSELFQLNHAKSENSINNLAQAKCPRSLFCTSAGKAKGAFSRTAPDTAKAPGERFGLRLPCASVRETRDPAVDCFNFENLVSKTSLTIG